MRATTLALLTLAAGGLLLPDLGRGHGGTYRGPGDFVPPGGGGQGGGGRPSVPGVGPGGLPSGPAGGVPTGPTATGGTGTGAAARPRTASTEVPVPLTGAPTGWSTWWEFNKDPYLNLKAAIHARVRTGTADFFLGQGQMDQARDTSAPTRAEVRDVVVPALLAALREDESDDVVSGCLVALAKVGDTTDESGASRLLEALLPFLTESRQEIRETTALALGVLASPASIDPLLELLRDTGRGRALVRDSAVDDRTRAFAAYGLGVAGSRLQEDDAALVARVVEALVRTLRTERAATRDVEVACTLALGLLPLPDVPEPAAAPGPRADDADADEAAWLSRAGQVRFLLELLADEGRAATTRAHAPRSLVRLLGDLPPDRRGALAQRVAPALLACLERRSGAHDAVKQSCVLALGALGDDDADELDVAIRAALMRAPEEHADQQTRGFALVALGQVAGRRGSGPGAGAGLAPAQAHLLRQAAHGRSEQRPWAFLGVGVLGRALDDAGRDVPRELAAGLRDALARERNPERLGACAVALGMLRDADAVPLLLERLDRLGGDDEARGYVALALGMCGVTGAVEPIQRVVRESKYRPALLRQAAIALGLLGDRRLVGSLTDMLREAKSLSSQAAIAAALGFIGDTEAIEPLVAMLGDETLTGAARGFAAVALGIVADGAPLPWSSALAVALNYRAAPATLNDFGGMGVLNIL